MSMSKKHVVVCLLNFFVSALMRLTLLYTFIDPVPSKQ